MKKGNLLKSLILCCLITICSGQKVIWTDLFTEYSYAQSLIKTTDGKILMAGALNEDSLFVATYDTDGNRLKRIIFPEWYNFSISLKELENGDFLLFSNSGNIWRISSSIDSVKIIFSTGFEIRNALHVKNESIIFGVNNKLVINTETYQALLRDTLITSKNTFAYQFSEDKEFYFDVTETFINLITKRNSQKFVFQFKNIDTMNKVSNTYLCNNGDLLLIGRREERINSKVTSTIVYRISEIGELKWSKKFIFHDLSSKSRAFKLLKYVTEAPNGDLLFTGTDGVSIFGPSSSILFVKLDSNGNILTEIKLDECSEGNSGEGILELHNEIYIAATVCTSDFGQPDRALLMKIENLTSEIENEVVPQFSIQPNPSSGQLTVEFYRQDMGQLSLFSSLGSLMKTIDVENRNKVEFQFADLHAGIYFIQCKDKNGRSFIKKWIKN